MLDVIPTPTIDRSERVALAASFALFALAGLGNATVDATVRPLAATALAVGGVYGLAKYARAVSRKRLAITAFAAWAAFLCVAAVHAIGVADVAAWTPAPGTTAALIGALTWASFLSAAAATAFLGLREYGAQSSAESPEDRVLEGGIDL